MSPGRMEKDPKIPKLEGSKNYKTWRATLRMYLESLSLWDIVSGHTTQLQKPNILEEYLDEDGEFKDSKI
ncbi:hypothetical protein VC83_05816 [Pseudogymnoascus destructans]|uniref:DUF4219 domain-containing protein n=1 Tax=Pseudogymnoascus destructans TaxID=655981 RepID=A0A177A7W7_9PEZI|nr:uncharacterized protein VC83_05816 [Pseudogymnoascus destructans]OAF57124.1 hypothetical protein VC83_05816 [Pseudogymnoascus destructans]